MRFDLITIFPEFFRGPLDWGVVRRAREAKLIEIGVHDLREFARDRHRTVDDRPFGGGEGMVLKPEPIFEAVEALLGRGAEARPPEAAILLLSASGRLFRQEMARKFAALGRVILLCGRYEGVDERVAEHLATDEIAVGDFVLSGGELPAAMILDAVTRLIPGALGNEDSAANESFSGEEAAGARQAASAVAVFEPQITGHAPRGANPGLLDFPQYTRPQNFRGWEVPEVLMSGNHEEIRRWRRRKALEKTLRNRPDLLADAPLSGEDRGLLSESKNRGA